MIENIGRIKGGPYAGKVVAVLAARDNSAPYFVDFSTDPRERKIRSIHKAQIEILDPVHVLEDCMDRLRIYPTARVFTYGAKDAMGLAREWGAIADLEADVDLEDDIQIINTPEGETLEVYTDDWAEAVAILPHLKTCLVPSGSTSDLKPRGVKRQWWLLPMDALNAAFVAGDRFPDIELFEALAAYQNSADKLSAAVVTNAAITELVGEVGTVGEALDLVVAVFEHGAEKYSADNWRKAAEDMDSFRREYYSAMCRHTFPKDDGEIDTDHVLPDGTEIKGSGLLHLAHLVCTCLMVLWHEMRISA